MSPTKDLRRSFWRPLAVAGAVLALVALSVAAPPVESQEPAAAKPDASRPRPP